MNTPLSSIGSQSAAFDLAQNVYADVPAYQAFIGKEAGLPSQWADIPAMDKASYLGRFPYVDLLSPDVDDTYTIFRSSGSSGQPFYWPQLRPQRDEVSQRFRQFLETAYSIDTKRTLTVVGLALGSWIGGEHFSWALKTIAATSSYPFSVFSPGNVHEEIVDVLHKASGLADQILLVVCPSAIGHLIHRAEVSGRPLPLHKLRFLVVGEPFAEPERFSLRARCEWEPGEAGMLSVYGSADTGVLGFESPVSALIRGMCQQQPELARTLGFDGVIPHLFHQADPEVFLETVDGELHVSKWQGIPLVRYNLHDAVQLISWQGVLEQVSEKLPEGIVREAEALPDLLAVTGRADACLMLCGTNLTEAMLDQAVRDHSFASAMSGRYRAAVLMKQGRQCLQWTIEITKPLNPDDVYHALVESLGRVQPEFKEDWENIYRIWDGNPDERILEIQLVDWPALSEENVIKQRGISS